MFRKHDAIPTTLATTPRTPLACQRLALAPYGAWRLPASTTFSSPKEIFQVIHSDAALIVAAGQDTSFGESGLWVWLKLMATF